MEKLLMKKPSKQKDEIRQQNRLILSNIAKINAEKQRNALRKKGYVLFTEAKDKGFRKVGYDVYQRKSDIDAGNIWAIENIEGEDWLVCYTDQNDRILRNIKAAAKDLRMNKTAAKKEAVVIQPGDLVEITPRHTESVHNKYKGKVGEAVASMPDRTKLLFKDGASLWIEDTDLTVVKDRRELNVGDTVRMFSRKNIEGKVLKFSRDKKFVTFEGLAGQKLTARLNDVCKITKTGLVVQNIFTDPDNPNEYKVLKEYMKGEQQQQQRQQGIEMPQPHAENTPEEGPGQDNQMADKFPPAIKANPSPEEMSAGTAVPASQYADTKYVGIVKRGRQLHVGDFVQMKSTGEQGSIVNISFDKKLGKFYMINFGNMEPTLVYDTDIMKLSPRQEYTSPTPGLPLETSPTRLSKKNRNPDKTAVLGPQFNNIKTAALEFVESMVAQALKNHETTEPGLTVTNALENELVKQAITMYMSKYLPIDLRQTLSSEDKNELSQWLYTAAAETEAPTTEDFEPKEDTPDVDVWDLQNNYRKSQTGLYDMAAEKLTSSLNGPLDQVKPADLFTLKDKQKFVRDAVRTMVTKAGMPTDASHLIAQHVVSFKDINWPLLRHGLSRMGYKNTEQILETAGDVFAFTAFETADRKKYALDLPGMETLRGGGGGYPGGIDVEPMKWEVKNPNPTPGGPAPEQLQNALQENLADQSVPFEEAAPKINIELDPESKKITIDYNQEEQPPIELEGANPNPIPEEGPNSGVAGPKPAPGQPQNNNPEIAGTDVNDMDVPINF